MNIAEKFHQFETSFDLNKFTIDGLWYYPLVKMAIYFELAGRKGKAVDVNDWRASGACENLRQFIRGIKWKMKSGPLRSVKYLFVDYASTRRQTQNGRFENMYIDPIMNVFGREGQLLFEYPSPDFGHYTDIETKNIYFPDWDIFKIFLRAKLKNRKWISDETHLKALYELFGLSFDARFMNDRLNKTFLFIKFFKKFLGKVRPQIILLIDGYDYKQMALIYAAKTLRIPTVELQHGLINVSHMAYMYNQVADRRLFTDYLFTFGEYFSELIIRHSVVWESHHVISVGFPYIEAVKERPLKLSERLQELARRFKIVYVTSQWTVRTELRDFILQLSGKLDDEYMIFYKIHPGEKDAQKFYESFSSHKNIELILDKTVNSMEFMKVAAVHSTVYSTSYFESVFFELPNIFIEVSGYSKTIDKFVDGETTFLLKSIDEYIAHLAKLKTDASLTIKLKERRTTFYKVDALKNTITAINEILMSTRT